jgi:DNA-binding transcriptional MerR regulator
MMVDELLAEARRMIAEKGIKQDPLSRVSESPDLRSFRLYRLQGLIDQPEGKQGVAGVYGRKHMLQLVAIKALQARRLPLREIRIRLAKAGDDELNGLIDGSGFDRTRPMKKAQAVLEPANEDRRWMQIQLTPGAFAMVDEALLKDERPSSLRSLGESLSARLLSLRKR